MTATISIIMPCHNRAHDLLHVLKAYDQQHTNQSFEVIAIDDASSDATYHILATYQPAHYVLRVERLEQNQGPAAARNRGISLAAAPLVIFVGDDILPSPSFVQSHFEAHEQRKGADVAVLGRVTWPKDMICNTLMAHIDGVGAQQFSYHYLQDGQEYDFRHFYTANISMKLSLLRQTESLFDTSFPYAAFEDAELAYRLSKRGMRIVYNDQPVGYHYHYHTIWTFSKRQYRAGLMACKVAEKHPELTDFLRVTKTKYLLPIGVIHRVYQDASVLADAAELFEQQILNLTSFYEWTPHLLLDELYLKVLEYFWRKGLIDGTFEASTWQPYVRNAYTIYHLGDFLKDYLARVANNNIPAPIKNGHCFNDKLMTLENPILKSSLNWWQATGYNLTKNKLYPEKFPSG